MPRASRSQGKARARGRRRVAAMANSAKFEASDASNTVREVPEVDPTTDASSFGRTVSSLSE